MLAASTKNQNSLRTPGIYKSDLQVSDFTTCLARAAQLLFLLEGLPWTRMLYRVDYNVQHLIPRAHWALKNVAGTSLTSRHFPLYGSMTFQSFGRKQILWPGQNWKDRIRDVWGRDKWFFIPVWAGLRFPRVLNWLRGTAACLDMTKMLDARYVDARPSGAVFLPPV